MTHYDEMTCLLYLDGQLDSVRAGQMSVHLDTCTDCRRLLAAFERESEHLRAALCEQEEAVPARLLAGPESRVGSWAWIVSFGLAAAGAWTLWTGFVEPWGQQLSDAGFGGNSALAVLFFGGVFWEGWSTMATMMQLLATTSLGLLALVVFRRHWRRLPWVNSGSGMSLWMMAACLAVMLALPAIAEGAEVVRKKTSYTLAEGETLAGDLYLLGVHTARIDGTVEGDVVFFGQSLAVNGRVSGDILGFGQSLRIHGEVGGNIRAFGNNITLRGSVERNVTSFAQTIEIEDNARVGGSVTAFFEGGTFEGRIGRDLMTFADRLQLNGYVGGKAEMRGRNLSIGPSAEISGKASWRGQKEADVDGAAKLASKLETEIVSKRPDYYSARFYWKQALRWGAAFLFGLVVMILAPVFFGDTVRSARRYGASLGFGAIALVATPILALIVCITIVGLAVGLSAMLLWALALYAAQIFVGVWLGERMLGEAPGTPAMLGRLALGLLVIRIAGNLPYLGGWFWFAVILWGMGAVVLATARRMRPPEPVEPVLASAA